MIPQGGVTGSVAIQQASQLPSRTYRLDMNYERIIGMVDGLEAVKQAVFKILQTERFEHFIYDSNYGSELSSLPGNSSSVVRSELGRRIRQSLLQDDRITDVQDMNITITGDEALAEFTVVSTYGSFQASKGVSHSV